eukprot:COSAG01_NODE_1278_length_10930_cov_22.050226_4_plen_168_part_00
MFCEAGSTHAGGHFAQAAASVLGACGYTKEEGGAGAGPPNEAAVTKATTVALLASRTLLHAQCTSPARQSKVLRLLQDSSLFSEMLSTVHPGRVGLDLLVKLVCNFRTYVTRGLAHYFVSSGCEDPSMKVHGCADGGSKRLREDKSECDELLRALQGNRTTANQVGV